MDEVKLLLTAYAKIVLHVSKYPHCQVNGLLLGKKQRKNENCIHLTNSVPLFHLNLGVCAMTEIALTLIDHYCKDKDLIIYGHYHANENLKNTKEYMKKLRSMFHLIDNSKLSMELQESILIPLQLYDGKWKSFSLQFEESETFSTVSALLQQHQYRQIVDFDDHLNNTCLDYFNTWLDILLEHSI